jgi:hypothetical protein
MSAKQSMGSSIARGDGEASEVFFDIADVVSISGVNLARDQVDTTILASPNGYEEALPTVLRTGELEIGLNFVPDEPTQTQFLDDMIETPPVLHNYRVTFSDGTAWTFPAFVVGFTVGDVSPESKLEATATLKISGEPTFS